MATGRDREDGGAGKARPRRALLAAAAGGLGVIAGEAIGGAAPALADNGQAVLQGTDNGTPTARTAALAGPARADRHSAMACSASLEEAVRAAWSAGPAPTAATASSAPAMAPRR